MTNDLSDWTEPADPISNALVASGLWILGLVPVVGGPAVAAVQGTISYRQQQWLRTFASRVATRLRALEDRDGYPTTDEVLGSDEFVAACASTQQQLLRSATEEKRRRLAKALSRMGPWGPGNVHTRAAFLRLVDEYEDLHIGVLQFLADPVGRVQRVVPDYEPPAPMDGNLTSVIGLYMFPGEPNWREYVNPVISRLGRDALINTGGGLVTDIVDTSIMPTTTQRGNEFLAFVAERED